MSTFKKILLILIGVVAMVSSSHANNELVKEFISLDKKANLEMGHVIVDGKTTTLAYGGSLYFRENDRTQSQYSGLAVFGETDSLPTLIMSSTNMFLPDFKEIQVNLPDKDNGFTCTDISYHEQASKVLEDFDIILLTGHNCVGKGKNSALTQDITMKLTESMLQAGASRLELKHGIAYLNTAYILDDQYALHGALGTRAYNQVFDLVTHFPKVSTLVEQQVPGSIHDEINAQTGRLVRKSGLSIHLESTSNIASGGVDLFTSGKRRTMEEGATVGVHSGYDFDEGVEAADLPIDSPAHYGDGATIPYMTKMLGSPIGKEFYFFALYAAPFDEIYYMSRAEMEHYNLLIPDAREDSIKALFAWAEKSYTDLFSPSSAIIQRKETWLYAYYPETKTYVGVNDSDEVWVLGNQLGGFKYIDTLQNMLTMIEYTP